VLSGKHGFLKKNIGKKQRNVYENSIKIAKSTWSEKKGKNVHKKKQKQTSEDERGKAGQRCIQLSQKTTRAERGRSKQGEKKQSSISSEHGGLFFMLVDEACSPAFRAEMAWGQG